MSIGDFVNACTKPRFESPGSSIHHQLVTGCWGRIPLACRKESISFAILPIKCQNFSAPEVLRALLDLNLTATPAGIRKPSACVNQSLLSFQRYDAGETWW
jgi:hypothetical protein